MNKKIITDASKKYFASNSMLRIAIGQSVLVACMILANIESGYSVSVSVCSAAFSILMCVGMWMLFSGAKNDKASPGAFSFIKADVIAQEVVSIVIAAAFIFVGAACTYVGFAFEAGQARTAEFLEMFELSYNEVADLYGITDLITFDEQVLIDLAGIIGILLIFAGVIMLAIVILFYTKTLKGIKAVKLSATEGHLYQKFPTFVKVCLYILTVILGFSVITGVMYAALGMIWTFLLIIANFVEYIFILIGLNNYRDTMAEAGIRVQLLESEGDDNVNG